MTLIKAEDYESLKSGKITIDEIREKEKQEARYSLSISELKKRMAQLSQEANRTAADEIHRLQEESQLLSRKNQLAEEYLVSLKEQAGKDQKIKDGLEGTIKKLEQANKEFAEVCKNNENELSILNKKYSDSETQKNNLNTLVQALQNKLDQECAAAVGLERELTALRDSTQEDRVVRARLEQENQKMLEQFSALRGENGILADEVRSLKKQTDLLEKNRTALDAEINNLKAHETYYKNSYAQLDGKFKTLQEENNSLRANFQEINKNYDSVKLENEKYLLESNSLKEDMVKVHELIKSFEDVKNTDGKEYAQLKVQFEEMKNKYGQLEENYSKLHLQFEEKNSECEKLLMESKRDKDLLSEYKDWEEKVTREINDMHNEIDEAKEFKKKGTEEYKSLRNHFLSLQKAKSEVESELEKVRNRDEQKSFFRKKESGVEILFPKYKKAREENDSPVVDVADADIQILQVDGINQEVAVIQPVHE